MPIPETGGLLKSVKRLSQLADLRFVCLNTLRQSHIDVIVNFGIQEGSDNIHFSISQSWRAARASIMCRLCNFATEAKVSLKSTPTCCSKPQIKA